MKSLRLLVNFFKGSRASAVVVAIMLTVSLLLSVYVVAKVSYTAYDYRFLDKADVDGLVSVMSFPTKDSEGHLVLISPRDVEERYRDCEVVKGIQYFPSCTCILQNFPRDMQTGIKVVLVDEDFISKFQGFKEAGVDLSLISDDSRDCIVISPYVQAYEVGDTIEAMYLNESVSFEVVGHSKSPYKFFSLDSSTNIDYPLGEIFYPQLAVSNVVIMKRTEENERRFIPKDSYFSSNFIIEFDTDVSEDEINRVKNELVDSGMLLTTFNEIKENTRESMKEQLRTELPLPMFLLFVSFVAYVSQLVLIFKKKKREFAVSYTCGASVRRIGMIFAVSSFIIAIPALLVNSIVVAMLKGRIRDSIVDDGITPTLNFGTEVDLVIIGYALVSIAIAVLITRMGMRRYSPKDFLRSVDR